MNIWQVTYIGCISTPFGETTDQRTETLIANSFEEIAAYIKEVSEVTNGLLPRKMIRIERLGSVDRIVARQ